MTTRASIPTIFELGSRRSLVSVFVAYGGVFLILSAFVIFFIDPRVSNSAVRPVLILYSAGFFTIPIAFWFCRSFFEMWIDAMTDIDPTLRSRVKTLDTSFLGASKWSALVGLCLGTLAVFLFREFSVLSTMNESVLYVPILGIVFLSAGLAGVALVSLHRGIQIMLEVSNTVHFDIGDVRGGLDETGNCLSRCYIAISGCWLPYVFSDVLSQKGFVEPWFSAFGLNVYPIFFIVGLPVSLFLLARFFEVQLPLQQRIKGVIRTKTRMLVAAEKEAFDNRKPFSETGQMDLASTILQLRRSIEDTPTLPYNYMNLVGALSPVVLPIAVQVFGS